MSHPSSIRPTVTHDGNLVILNAELTRIAFLSEDAIAIANEILDNAEKSMVEDLREDL